MLEIDDGCRGVCWISHCQHLRLIKVPCQADGRFVDPYRRTVGLSPLAELKRIVSPKPAAVFPNQLIYISPADRAPLKDGSQIYSASIGSHLEPDDQPDFLFDVALGEPRVLKGQTVLEAFPLL